MSNNEPTKESVKREFPGWELFTGTDRRWHALIRGSEAPTVHGDDLEDLREEIMRADSEIRERAWRKGLTSTSGGLA